VQNDFAFADNLSTVENVRIVRTGISLLVHSHVTLVSLPSYTAAKNSLPSSFLFYVFALIFTSVYCCCVYGWQKSLVGRRDDLTQKHDDAALLHSDIERRSRPLLLTLCSALSPTDFADVEYQALMRTQLVVELQDVDTAISLADRQLALLRTSVNGSAEGEIDA